MINRDSPILEIAPLVLTLLAVIVLLATGTYVPGQVQAEIDPQSTELSDLRKLVRLGNRSSCTDVEYKNEINSTAENDVTMTIEIEWRTIGQELIEADTFEVEVPAASTVPILFEPPSGELDQAITSCGVNIINIQVE